MTEEEKKKEVEDTSVNSVEKTRKTEEKPKRTQRKTQGQLLQEALGLEPGQIEKVEKKLFIAKFLDYFSESTMDFIYKDKSIQQYKNEITKSFEFLKDGREEDKLLEQSFESKQIYNGMDQLKGNAEKLAASEGIKKPFDKKLRTISLLVTIPMFAIILVLAFIPDMNYFVLFPLLCVFCMVPTIIRGYIVKKWFAFKEKHKNQFYTDNREEIVLLKDYTSQVLNNIRTHLIELKVPLQLITFPLFSRDYENVVLKNQYSRQGVTQYIYNFEYPEGMEPFPIPEQLKQKYQKPTEKFEEKQERNFIVLKELRFEGGVIVKFVPSLKESLADDINKMLNECEFAKATKSFEEIVPNYSSETAIYCVCGEIAEIESVQICNWKNEFKFYLFEGKSCACDEKVYALSLMDATTRIPEEFKKIFSD